MEEQIASMALQMEEHPELAGMFASFMLDKVPEHIDSTLEELNKIVKGLITLRDAVAEASLVAND